MQDLALGFVDLHGVCTGPAPKPAELPLDGFPSLQHVNCTTGAGESTLSPTDKDVKQSCRDRETNVWLCNGIKHKGLEIGSRPKNGFQLYDLDFEDGMCREK